MIADGLTKALTAAKYESFVEMTGMEDQSELLASVLKEEELKEALQRRTGPEISESFGYGANAT